MAKSKTKKHDELKQKEPLRILKTVLFFAKQNFFLILTKLRALQQQLISNLFRFILPSITKNTQAKVPSSYKKKKQQKLFFICFIKFKLNVDNLHRWPIKAHFITTSLITTIRNRSIMTCCTTSICRISVMSWIAAFLCSNRFQCNCWAYWLWTLCTGS